MELHREIYLIIIALSFSILLIPGVAYANHSNQTYSIPINATHNATVPCFATNESGMCGFIDNPWNAIKHALFVDYLGAWFIAVIYFPLVIVVLLLTKNGTYAGLVGITIVAGTGQAETLAFEVMLPLIAISTGLAFFEVLRKRVME